MLHAIIFPRTLLINIITLLLVSSPFIIVYYYDVNILRKKFISTIYNEYFYDDRISLSVRNSNDYDVHNIPLETINEIIIELITFLNNPAEYVVNININRQEERNVQGTIYLD